MKKMTTAGVAFAAALILAACGQGSGTAASTELSASESTTQSTTASSADQEEASETIFKGTIQEDAATGSDDTIQVFLKDVEAVADDDDMVKNFQNDGVILHVPIAAFDGEVTELAKGTTVEVTLQGLPIMTMSIPPQIPGNSIKQVTIVSE
ncbi:hypothetical protein A5886_001393 [Enterococcus sp. 8G7_MSG3316]|uniref:Lipoprotein n=1 Tax=Candidatus Enterococcus testudinis TaxID=1834191 RepID=A0A242A5K3_9ENTE|nr:hypothetical protein [Enterococcus sp. 8G7_MSG3316]OTN76316.1 hypothetical protein A5886_001393 [Enterococcus sp. 8G7_MSG3316]